MAFGMGHSRGGRPSGGSSFRGGSAGFRGTAGGNAGFRGGSGGLGGFSGPRISQPSRPVMPSSPVFGGPIAPPPVNFGSRRHGGGGLVSSLLGSAVSAGVGVASAAIVNKMHENSQIKLAEKQAEQQAEFARQQAELARQQAEYQVEIEKIKAQQEEIKRDVKQDKKYYANCPYCLGANSSGGKFCEYCGSSLAYYDEDEEDLKDDKKPESGNAAAQQ